MTSTQHSRDLMNLKHPESLNVYRGLFYFAVLKHLINLEALVKHKPAPFVLYFLAVCKNLQ